MPFTTRVILTNAVTFKGAWAKEFSKASTESGPFTLLAGARSDTPLMHMRDRFDYAQIEGCKALAMDFLEGPFRMVFLLPPRQQFLDFEASLTQERLARIFGTLHEGHQTYRVTVTLPNFRLDSEPHVQEALKAAGLVSAFSDSANFNCLSRRPLKLDEVLHRAMVEVDEKGAEAAATSVATMIVLSAEPSGGEPRIAEFKADHPFLFLIQDRASGTILFMGHYLHP